jgi:hypothetical protein
MKCISIQILFLAFSGLILSGCEKASKEENTAIKVAAPISKATVTRPNPKLVCNDPLLVAQMQDAIAKNVYQPKFLLNNYSDIFEINFPAFKENSRELIDVGNGKKVERLKCDADINIKLIEKDLFEQAATKHRRIFDILGEHNFRRLSGLDAECRTCPNPLERLGDQVSGITSYVAALQDSEEERNKGNYFAINVNFNIKYLQEFRVALASTDQIMSLLELDFKVSKVNSAAWQPSTRELLQSSCKRNALQISQCECIFQKLAGTFSDKEFRQAQISSNEIEESSKPGDFPFNMGSNFMRLYDSVWAHAQGVVTSCTK